MTKRSTHCRGCQGLLVNLPKYTKSNPKGICKPCHNTESRNRYAVISEKLFTVLGNECMCCGEQEKAFLTFDHINGGGTQHRKKRSSQGVRYDMLTNTTEYQILCWNCNWAKHNDGCPHVTKKVDA